MTDLPFSHISHDLLSALRHGPLDTHQLASDLVSPSFAVEHELEQLAEAGLVRRTTIESDRRAWSLTTRGRVELNA